LTKAKPLFREEPILSLVRMLHEDYDRDGLVAKKFLVVILKELGVKMN
jgi:hypothetical protein